MEAWLAAWLGEYCPEQSFIWERQWSGKASGGGGCRHVLRWGELCMHPPV